MKNLILIALAALLLSGLLFAQAGMAKNPNAHPGMGPMKDMNLTDAQKTKVEELRLSHQKQMNTLDAEIQNLEMDMQQAMQKEDFVNARKLTKQLNDKRLVAAYARIDHMEAMLKQLTPEQKEKAKGMFMGMGKGMGMGHGNGMGMENCKGDCMDKMQPQQMHQMKQGQDCMQGQTLKKDAEGNCQDCQGHQTMDKTQPKTNATKPEPKK